MAAKLRAVSEGETAPPKLIMTVLEAIEAGDRMAELEATHRRIGRAVQDESTPARDLASLTRRQMEISKEIESLKRQRVEESKNGSEVTDSAFDAQAI
ncbi:hypothetical protein [Plantibacter sp. H53]|uniref:hypothetical protein n=1 Tax=Plantibacter sp. H53 TaxID=1827323 RepID=UPI0018D2D67D|nr:hypothetical protein [Plantibacter sp. H53]